MSNIHVNVIIHTVFVNEDAKKRYDRTKILHTTKIYLKPGESLQPFVEQFAKSVQADRTQAEVAVSRITEMRERVAQLSGDLAKAGFHDASKEIQQMAVKLAPSDTIDDDDDDLEDDD